MFQVQDGVPFADGVVEHGIDIENQSRLDDEIVGATHEIVVPQGVAGLGHQIHGLANAKEETGQQGPLACLVNIVVILIGQGKCRLVTGEEARSAGKTQGPDSG